jgi:hypothetical protein
VMSARRDMGVEVALDRKPANCTGGTMSFIMKNVFIVNHYEGITS